MKKLTCLFALGFLLFNNTLRANEPEKVTSTEEVSETTAKKERIKQVTKYRKETREQVHDLTWKS